MTGSSQTRAFLLTPLGRGAIATVAIEGGEASRIVSKCFQPKSGSPIEDIAINKILVGSWRSGQENEELVVVRRAEHQWEIHAHGGLAAVTSILHSLSTNGAQVADWKSWVLTHEPDRLAAEAREALAYATTQRAAALLLDQYRGALRDEIQHALHALTAGDDDQALRCIEQLLARASLGSRLTQPWRVAIVGPPNVGKSSLMNRIVGYGRSIVFDEPGTTRDVVTALTAIDGWAIEFSDTAGLRSSDDEIESLGVSRAREAAQGADLILYVNETLTAPEDLLAERGSDQPRILLVLNKCDRLACGCVPSTDWLGTSALTGAGIPELLDEIIHALVPMPPTPGLPLPFLARHVTALRAAAQALRQKNLNDAAVLLSQLLTP